MKTLTRIAGLVAFVAAALVAAPRLAAAHDVRGENVFLDFGETTISVEMQIPALQLAHARGKEMDPGEDLSGYVRDHVRAETSDGRRFAVEVDSVDMQHIEEGDTLVARLRLVAPEGASTRTVAFEDEVVLEHLVTHDVYFFVRRDLRTGATGDESILAGIAHYQHKVVTISRDQGSLGTAFASMLKLGARHIAEGSDHLLFLLALLIIAPLSARAGRWAESAPLGSTVRRMARIVTAFTIGHSLTLAIGATGGPVLPSRAVEVVVAVSIFVSAAHALRPLFFGREAYVAALFGLFHGLAFASALEGFGFDRTTLVVSLLGFNVGVEAMQLAVVVLTMPWLVLLSRGPVYSTLRALAALFAGAAASGWIIERLFDVSPLPTSRMVDAIAAHALFVVPALAAASLVDYALRRARPEAERAGDTTPEPV